MNKYQEIAQMLDANAIQNTVDAYNKGRADAIDECKKMIDETWLQFQNNGYISPHTLKCKIDKAIERLQ